jgi:uncharacterized delta-60 repeat protein
MSNPVVFRFDESGSLDTGFGDLGVFKLDFQGPSGASSVVVEADGRIAVAGIAYVPIGEDSEPRLIVLRLLANGRLDTTFGEEGVFTASGPDATNGTQLMGTTSGTYRVVANGPRSCVVIGVTADGTLDTAFANGGMRIVLSEQGNPVSCQSADQAADGSLLLAGSEIVTGVDGDEQPRGFARRLMADGSRDSLFAPDEAIADSLAEVTSIASGVDGAVLVAGWAEDRASIMRLQVSGATDPAFGNGGRTWIDLPTDSGGVPIVRDMAVRADGSVIAAGGNGEPFVVRLLGSAGGSSPGVLAFTANAVEVSESGEALVRVRRTGGSDGDVRVDYRTVADDQAVGGEDFTPVSGTLHWPSGDTSEREIEVVVLEDDASEGFEAFTLSLEYAGGGAGLGRQHVAITIQADGAPAGLIEFSSAEEAASEDGPGQFWIERRYYSEGPVCVTVAPTSGTAISAVDFGSATSIVCWDDQDVDSKMVEVPIIDDNHREDIESFSLALSAPTGGAVIGAQDTATVTLYDNEPPPVRGGGGPAGLVEILLLALLAASQRRELIRRITCLALLWQASSAPSPRPDFHRHRLPGICVHARLGHE